MGQWLPILALLVLAAAFGAISIVASRLLNPPRPTAAKVAPYECGIVDQVDAPERFSVRFYLIAMIFVVFDIEIIFLYPYSTVFRELGVFGMVAVAIFAGAVFESFLYLVRQGALNWGPVAVSRRTGDVVSASRTATTTVRRVGAEGRATVIADERVA